MHFAITDKLTYAVGGASVAQEVADSALDEKVYIYGEYFATHGIFLLSWSEVIVMNMAFFVTYKFMHGMYSFVKEIRSDMNTKD